MRICLINPGYALDVSENNEYSISGYTVPHLGLGYICSYLIEKGYQADLIECMGQGITNQDLFKLIESTDYGVIGISIYDENRINAMRIIKKIRQIKPDAFVFLGGYMPTLSCELALRYFDADCVVLGEGEITVYELIKTIEEGGDFKKVSGVAFLDSTRDCVVFAKKRAIIDNLDTLPIPTRAFYKNQTLSMISSRGCCGHCIYCSIVSFYKFNTGCKYRYRSADNVYAELNELLKRYPDCKLVWFFDDNFLESDPNNRIRLFRLCDLLKEKNIIIPFNITACAKDVINSVDLLKELKSVGLNQVFVGIESLCKRQLDFYGKDITPEENIKAYNILRKLNIKVNMGFIPMDPFVTIEEIKSNFQMLQKYNITNDAYNLFSIHMHIVSVRGTPLRGMLDKKGLTENNEKGYSFLDSKVNVLYETVREWHKIILPMVGKSDMITFCQENDKICFEKLDDIFKKLIMLDVEYVISLCECLEKKFDKFKLNEHLEVWKRRFEVIYADFLSVLLGEANMDNL